MKEYRLAAWPELRPPYQSTAYRRMLSEMSQRHVTLWQLVRTSGLRKLEVQNFVEMLAARGLIAERTCSSTALFGSLRPFGSWLRRSWTSAVQGD